MVLAGVSFPDKSFGKESRIGVPFTFLLRNILQFDNTLNASITRIQTAHRTCDLILGVGDGKPEAETMRGFEVRACCVAGNAAAELPALLARARPWVVIVASCECCSAPCRKCRLCCLRCR